MEKDTKNRIIKFRGKQICDGIWVYGNLIIYSETDYEIEWFCDIDKRWYRSKVVPETVGQFTGFYDRNSKPIYEDDIITRDDYPFMREGKPNYVAMIEWFQYDCCFSAPLLLHRDSKARGISIGCPCEFNEDTQSLYEIIGNIFDNKDLLKGEKQ